MDEALLAKEFLQLHYREVGFLLPSQIVPKFYIYLREKEIAFEETAEKRRNLEFLFAQYKGKQWFTKLMRFEKQNRVNQKIITKQQRNEKFSKIVKFTNLDFVTDDEILLYILYFANIKDLLLLRSSCTYFLQFIEKNWNLLKNQFVFPIYFMIELDQSQCYCTSKHMIRSMCLLSGVDKHFVSQFVIGSSMVTQRTTIERYMDETELFSSCRSVLGDSWYGVIQQCAKRKNSICKVKLSNHQLNCNDVLVNSDGVKIDRIAANRMYAMCFLENTFNSLDDYLQVAHGWYMWGYYPYYKELIIIGYVDRLENVACNSEIAKFVSRMYLFTSNKLYIYNQTEVLQVQFKTNPWQGDKLTSLVRLLKNTDLYTSTISKYWQEMKQFCSRLQQSAKYLKKH